MPLLQWVLLLILQIDNPPIVPKTPCLHQQPNLPFEILPHLIDKTALINI